MAPLYAHSKPGSGSREGWHELAAHLQGVGELARTFAASWNAGEWAYIAGLWHDLGKAAADWQDFLADVGSEAHVLGEEQPRPIERPKRRGPDHSSAGAIHAATHLGSSSLPIQFAIAAHHAGLSDWEDLKARLREKDDRYQRTLNALDPASLGAVTLPSFPTHLSAAGSPEIHRHRFETFTRMLFSALVDGDFLDTERFYEGIQSGRSGWPDLAAYLPVLEAHLAAVQASVPCTPVNGLRRKVLEWCNSAAPGPAGAYTLTVPTGGGKTLSSLAFALRHARQHGLRRVVIALPFISVLDQTAAVLRDVFQSSLGVNVLVEHHSAIEPARDTARNRLAAENWDAPLVVTTQVQLFESLFSRRPSACRKLHNLARSVLILDEVQTLPTPLLAPILSMLQDLKSHYGVSLLLTTATQPALHSRQLGPWRFAGLDPEPSEIIPRDEMESLFAGFRRVRVRWPRDRAPEDWGTLADRVVQHPQVLAIVHRRQDAVDLWRAVSERGDGEVLHLSALMCPAHRRNALLEIRRRLDAGEGCRVVSTQLVEAGVDVDFPVVFRAMAGLEALAQSAGRCNREGRLPFGLFEVFHPSTEPPGLLRLHRDEARLMLDEDPELDLTAPSTFSRYFDRVYGLRKTDARGVQALRAALRFEATAQAFRMIDTAGEPVFIPYGDDGRRALGAFRHAGPSRDRFRLLQPFGVNVYPQQLREMLSAGAIETLHQSIYVLRDERLYDEQLGLRSQPEPDEAWIA